MEIRKVWSGKLETFITIEYNPYRLSRQIIYLDEHPVLNALYIIAALIKRLFIKRIKFTQPMIDGCSKPIDDVMDLPATSMTKHCTQDWPDDEA